MNRLLTITIASLLLVGLGEARAADGSVSLHVDVAEPQIRLDAHDRAAVRVPGAGRLGRPGQPDLPVKTLRIAVPPDAVPGTIEVSVTPTGETRLEGRLDVRPAPPAAYIGTRRLDWGKPVGPIVDGRDSGVYGSSETYPQSWSVASRGLGAARRYRFVTVYLYPVRYRVAEQQLVRATGFDIEVSFARGASGPSWRADDCAADQLASKLLANYHQARSWYPVDCFGPPDGPPGVVVITTDELLSGSELLDDWEAMREDQGYEVTIATEADWDFTTGEDFDARADRIRKWIQDQVEPLDLGWVLLIGNPDPDSNVANSIPMKKCGGTPDDRGPTDFYYADISGNWDASGNGEMCEWNYDDLEELFGPGVDFVPEVYVGRIPAYSDGAIAVDDILAQVLGYEETTANGDLEWRRRMMLPNSIYFFKGQYGQPYARWDGATVGEWFIREQLVPRGMVYTTLYEHEGLDASLFESHFQVDTYNTVDQWVRGYGFVFWTGHGSSSGVYRTTWWEDENDNAVADWQEMGGPEFMSTSYLHMLDEAPPAFVVHGSCSNGHPESANNLGYNLVRRGAIATVSASRAAMTWHWPEADPEKWIKPDEWDGDVIDIVVEYAVNVLEGNEAGRALGDAIALTTDGHGDDSWYQKSIQNLYGDPLTRMVMCREDAECNNDLYCDGEELCDDGVCVPGEPVVCEATPDCAEMVCDDLLGCVPGPTCSGGDDTDDGSTPAPPGASVSGAGFGCSTLPARPTGALSSLLLELI